MNKDTINYIEVKLYYTTYRYMHMVSIKISYSIAENFRVSIQNKNFADKITQIAPFQLLCRCGPRTCATHPHTRNVRPQNFADKFSRMVLKPQKTRKFSPSKVFRYTVFRPT